MIYDTECSNLTEARWTQYICNHENNVSSRLLPQWLCANSLTWAHDVRLIDMMYDCMMLIYIYMCVCVYSVYIYILTLT